MEKKIMLGNEAFARGAYEAGVKVVSSYPGTPSTEVTENAAKYDEIYVEWAPNEKVGVEVAVGASIGGVRSLFLHETRRIERSGRPVFYCSIYRSDRRRSSTGSRRLTAVIPARTKQDSRDDGRSAGVPVLEPSNAQECKDYLKPGIRNQ